jgi:hypothetical protein
MRASFPTQFPAVLLGKSREAGSFKADDREVIYPDAYDLAFESSDGLTQTCRVSLRHLDEAADFDVAKEPKLTELHVVGDVQVRDDGASFRPTQVRRAKPVAKAA